MNFFGMTRMMPYSHPSDASGEEAAECIRCLSGRVEKLGYRIVVDRSDHAGSRVHRYLTQVMKYDNIYITIHAGFRAKFFCGKNCLYCLHVMTS